MPGHDDHDLERRLRENRHEAPDEFAQNLVTEVRSRRYPSARPRLTLAFALSLALLVSLVAFGGVGLAANALHATTSAVKSASGKSGHGRWHSHKHQSPAKKQYHHKVSVCYPVTSWTVTYKWVTKDKWIWKWSWHKSKHGDKSKRHHIKLHKLVKVKVKVHVKVVNYYEKTVSEWRVPVLVSKGAVYPVPADGCSTLDSQTEV